MLGEFDTETSPYYYRARYYDPSTGRFLTEDPAGFRGGINKYQYAKNSPVHFRDPRGLCPGGGDGGGIDTDALALCVMQLFGVTETSFTPSTPGDLVTNGVNGSFTGAMAGIFNGFGNPLSPGPSQFTVTNDVTKTWQLITLQEIRNGAIKPDEAALGYTLSLNPFINFSARNVSLDDLIESQIWELGNSLGFITGKQIPANWNYRPGPGNTEPGKKLLECFQGYTYE